MSLIAGEHRRGGGSGVSVVTSLFLVGLLQGRHLRAVESFLVQPRFISVHGGSKTSLDLGGLQASRGIVGAGEAGENGEGVGETRNKIAGSSGVSLQLNPYQEHHQQPPPGQSDHHQQQRQLQQLLVAAAGSGNPYSQPHPRLQTQYSDTNLARPTLLLDYEDVFTVDDLLEDDKRSESGQWGDNVDAILTGKRQETEDGDILTDTADGVRRKGSLKKPKSRFVPDYIGKRKEKIRVIPDYIGKRKGKSRFVPDYIGKRKEKTRVIPDYIGKRKEKSRFVPEYIGKRKPKVRIIPDYIGKRSFK